MRWPWRAPRRTRTDHAGLPSGRVRAEYVSQLPPHHPHLLEIAQLQSGEFDWSCSCLLINGGLPGGNDHPGWEAAARDAEITHSRQGEPIVRAWRVPVELGDLGRLAVGTVARMTPSVLEEPLRVAFEAVSGDLERGEVTVEDAVRIAMDALRST